MVAYAGMPLTDQDGARVGSLCAIDTQPHNGAPTNSRCCAIWRGAARCSCALRLAEYAAATERARRDELDAVLRLSYSRSRMLLEASQAFTDTASVQDIQGPGGRAGEQRSGAGLRGDGGGRTGRTVQRLRDSAEPPGFADRAGWDGFRWQDSPLPSAAAMRSERVQAYADREEFAAHHPPAVQALPA